MKPKNINLLITLVVPVLFSCNNDYLDLQPTTKLGDSPTFWQNESSLETFSNGFYNYIERDDFTKDFSSDNAEHKTNPPAMRRGDYVLPTALGSGGWNWSPLRNLNYFIGKVETANLEPVVKKQNIALAKFFRAWFYFKKVQQFGDVPWYSKPLSTNDEALIFKARDPRVLIMDSVMNDINYAIEHLSVTKSRNKITKWTSLALKSRIALYEGTYRKYHKDAGLPNSNIFLEEAASASKQLMDGGAYMLYSTGNVDKDYFNLFQPKDTYIQEVILARSTENQNFYYTPLFTSTSNGNYGATKSLIDNYLMKNGKTFQEQYPNEAARNAMVYFDEFKDRDPRLKQTLVAPGYIRVGTTQEALTDFAQNTTGYMVHKHVGPPIEDQGGGKRDVIMIRYAEILLNYAEAKAELGTLTQVDLDQTINVIRLRVGIPPLNISNSIDPYLNNYYQNSSSAMILEIRRERRVELAFEGFRTDDLKRWNEGNLFRAKYEGIYIKGFNQYIDLNNDLKPDLYVIKNNETPPADRISGVQYYRLSDVAALSNGDHGRLILYNKTLPTFQNHEYLSPIPTEEITLNRDLIQNPGWK